MHELSRPDFRKILEESTEDSALRRQITLARLHGIDLEWKPEALDAITEAAISLGTGARGLHRLIGQAVDQVDHRWPELADDGVCRVIVTRACVEQGAEPERVEKTEPCETRDTFSRIDGELRHEASQPTSLE